MSRAASTPVRRAVRQFLMGGGPLKRRSDRVQVIGRLLVVLSFVLCGPVAVAVATATTQHLTAVAEKQAAERHQVQATVLEDAELPAGWSSTDGHLPKVVFTSTRWAEAGQVQERNAPVAVGTQAGSVVSIWVNTDGVPTRAPLDRDAVSRSAMTTAAMALAGLPVAGFCVYALLCLTLDARRTRQWEQEWAAVEPRWSTEQLN